RRSPVEERHLPEDVAGTERAGQHTLAEHLDLAGEDDVQAVALAVLGDDHLSGERVARAEPGGQLPALASLQRTEERRGGEEVAEEALAAEGLQRRGDAGVTSGELDEELTGDLQHLRVVGERVDAGGARSAGEERHLAEELADLERRDRVSEPVVLAEDGSSAL